MQLGALFASGFTPDQIMSWTWAQIRLASMAVRAYHTDLAASLWTGKSPAVQAAKKAVANKRVRQELLENLRAQRPGISERDAAILIKEEEQLKELQRYGFAVNVSKVGENPDLFKLAAELKADKTVPKAPPRDR